LIRCACAARLFLVAGLTCFLCPRGFVADFFAAVVVFFFDDDVAVFFDDDFAALLLEPLFFFVEAVAVAADPVLFEVVSSLLFPSAGITTRSAQRTAANTRAGMVADERKETKCILPM